jgi:hypothetical protein
MKVESLVDLKVVLKAAVMADNLVVHLAEPKAEHWAA